MSKLSVGKVGRWNCSGNFIKAAPKQLAESVRAHIQTSGN